MEVNAQLVIDHLLAQNRQLVAEIAVLRAHLEMDTPQEPKESSSEN